MEITLYKHAQEVSLTLKSVLTFAFWVWGGGERRGACSDVSLGWLSGVRVCGGSFTSQMESDRINCACVNQSPSRCRVFFLPAQETKQFELEGVVYIFYFVFVMTPFTILWQLESLIFSQVSCRLSVKCVCVVSEHVLQVRCCSDLFPFSVFFIDYSLSTFRSVEWQLLVDAIWLKL